MQTVSPHMWRKYTNTYATTHIHIQTYPYKKAHTHTHTHTHRYRRKDMSRYENTRIHKGRGIYAVTCLSIQSPTTKRCVHKTATYKANTNTNDYVLPFVLE